MLLPSIVKQRIANGLLRLVNHLALLAVVFVLLALALPQLLRPDLPAVNKADTRANPLLLSSRGLLAAARVALDNDTSAAADDFDLQAAVMPTSTLPLAANGNLFKVPVPQTIIPKRPRKDLVLYTVQAGDNLSNLAEKYDLDVDTIIWANDKLEEDPDYLSVGQELIFPPVSGVLYTMKDGDTITAVAQKFKIEMRVIQELEYNSRVMASAIVSGTKVMIPGGEKPYQPRLVYINGAAVMVNAPKGGGRFMWPTQGYISTFFGENGHAGIDIAGPMGTPIYAADAGVVVFAGWNGGYGNCVIIDHGNGFETVYGHFMAFYPQVGQNVRRGQALGKMGSTGNSTGPHLHFEMHRNGALVNPLAFLPQ